MLCVTYTCRSLSPKQHVSTCSQTGVSEHRRLRTHENKQHACPVWGLCMHATSCKQFKTVAKWQDWQHTSNSARSASILVLLWKRDLHKQAGGTVAAKGG